MVGQHQSVPDWDPVTTVDDNTYQDIITYRIALCIPLNPAWITYVPRSEYLPNWATWKI